MGSAITTDFALDEQSSFDTKLRRCRFQRRLGMFNEAVLSLEGLQIPHETFNTEEQALVAGEIAWTRLLQGFFTESYETLSQWSVSSTAIGPISRETKAFLELLMEFSRVNCHGDPKRSIEIARKTFDQMLQHADVKDHSYALIQIEAFYQRIMLFAAEMRIIDRESTRARTKARLKPLFDLLCTADRWEELMIIADILVLVLDWPENAELFISMLEAQNLPQLEKARAHFEIGNLFESHGIISIADKHFEVAERGFKDLGHLYGGLDIAVARSGRGRKGGPSGVSFERYDHGTQNKSEDEWLEILPELCSRYKELAFPIGMLRALLKFGEFARLVGNFELAYKAGNVCSDIALETGSRFFWIQFQITMLAASLSQTGHEPTVIVSGLGLIEETKKFQIPYLAGTVASLLSLACSKLPDGPQSTYWAEVAAEALKDSTAGEKSLQEYRSALANLSQNISEDQLDQHLQRISIYLSESIEKDLSAKFWKSCADKLLLLSQVQFTRYRTSSVALAVQEMEKYVQRALDISEKLERNEQLRIFHSAQFHRVDGLILQAKEEPGVEKEKLAVQYLRSTLEICDPILTPPERGYIYCRFGSLYWSILRKESSFGIVADAIDVFVAASEIAGNLGITDLCINSRYGVAYSVWLASVLNEFPAEEDTMVLACFLELEKWTDQRRNELSALRTLDATRAKQSLSTHKNIRTMYAISFDTCLRLGRVEEGWHWIQKGKARSVSDMLGLGIKIPKRLLADLQEDPTLLLLWEEEKVLQGTLSELPQEKQHSFRKEIEMLQQRMGEFHGLRGIMGLRKGDAPTLSNLQWVYEDQALPTRNRSIIFVDWVLSHDGDISMLVVNKSRYPLHFKLDINVAQVEDWRKDHFLDPYDKDETLNEEDDDEDGAFRELDGLVDKLQLCSSPGDLLVFSPSGPLHCLPLHALRLPGDPQVSEDSMLLIERNPIIYSPSVTILEQCVLRAQSGMESSRSVPPAIIAVYEDQSEGEYLFDTAERTAIYEHSKSLGHQLNATSICGGDVTKASFAKHSANAPLIHFHGHCRFDSADVLSQALMLKDDSGGEQYPPSQSLPPQTPYDAIAAITRLHPETPNEISVEDIFNLKLSSSHITLIACDSASQKVSAGDEPLGIVTAFLCAGAASVIGTLWPTATREGRAFSEAFYRCLGDQDSAGDVFDYAEALREAVLSIRNTRDSRLPYYWAPFVLHGAWFGKAFDIREIP